MALDPIVIVSHVIPSVVHLRYLQVSNFDQVSVGKKHCAWQNSWSFSKTRVLGEKSIPIKYAPTWYDFQQFLNNPDEINSVKNRKGREVFEEEYDGKLSYFWWKRFKHALSYVNELQIEKGPLNDGLVDIRGVDYNAFDTFCDANP